MKSSITILYDAVKKRHVFSDPGKYTVTFVLQWNWRELQRSAVKTTVEIEVLDWDIASPESIITAKRLWMDRDLAYEVQTGTELSASSLRRLRKLAEEYPETVYGKLAVKLLDKTKRP